MGSAQLDTPAILDDSSAAAEPAGSGLTQLPALRQEAAERLAAHRLRRARHAQVEAEQPATARTGARRHKAASAVLERFAQTPSYRAVLAAEARRALEEASAAAEVAARNAEAVAAAHQELLAELGRYDEPVAFTPETAIVVSDSAQASPTTEAAPDHTQAAVQASAPEAPTLPVPAPDPAAGVAPARRQTTAAGLTIRLYEDAGRTRPAAPATVPALGSRNRTAGAGNELDPAEALALAEALDDEILFRKAPVFEEYAPHEPAVPLPANLLEFPRQLVAAKKARPRLAEGPLREDAPGSPQLRIFEVSAAQTAPAAEASPVSTFWADSIWLDAHMPTEPVAVEDCPTPVLPSLLPPQVAPLQLRLMSAAMDALLVAAGFLSFVAAAAHFGGDALLAAGPSVLAGGALAVLLALYFSYQVLFFTLTDATPGMRYARIGLCTFSDENPSRSAMRRRIFAQVVAVCPLGLGILWMLLDDDRLGWHDRISRMYQRAY